MDKIYIVDALHVLFRSYYAIRGMTNPQGESTNALYGFIRSIYKLMKDFSPEALVIVFDAEDNKKRRTEMYAEYKSHRKPMPEDLVPQVSYAHKFCEYAGLPLLAIPGVEADDTIGAIAKWATSKKIKSFLCSGDKDLCQLVDDHVKMINLQKDNLLVDAKKVKEIYGVTPEQIIDYLAIVGDASDNIPGLEGFGPKTASALLQKHHTLDEILAHPEKIPGPKKQEIAKRDKKIALLSRELATIHTDIKIPHDESFYHIKEPNIEKLRSFYQEMHFMSLLKELGDKPSPEKQHIKTTDKKTSYELIDSLEELEKLVHTLSDNQEICVDTETTGIDPMRAELVGIGLGTSPAKASYIPLNGSIEKQDIIDVLEPFFSKKSLSFFGHNIKYDLHILRNSGLEIRNVCFDTLIASYLITPQNPRHNLNELSLEYFGKVKTPINELIGKGKMQLTMADVPLEKISAYCCEDVDYTIRLKNHLEKELDKNDLTKIFEKIELPLLPILAKMEERGIYCDSKSLSGLSSQLAKQIKELETKVHHHAKEEFNLNSPKQLSDILFTKLKIKPIKKTQTGYSTNADVLEILRADYPIVGDILEYRGLEKLRSTYIDALPNQINPKTGRIHCTFSQSTTATGRLASQNPNLQNIPVRSALGKKIRSAFKPQDPKWSFLSADYSQIELRLLAHFSEDPLLLKAFHAGEDIHAFTASEVFDIPLSKVTPEMRHKAKAVNFGILYGQQAFGLAQGLSISYREASDFIKTYFKRYQSVKEYLEFCKESARKTGKAYTLTGRQRPIPEIDSKNSMIRSAAERLAINTPLQGTTADIAKMAMIDIDNLMCEEKNLGYMLVQIHDELLFEAPDDKIQHLASLAKNTMENITKLKVPLTVNISIGKNWGEC